MASSSVQTHRPLPVEFGLALLDHICEAYGAFLVLAAPPLALVRRFWEAPIARDLLLSAQPAVKKKKVSNSSTKRSPLSSPSIASKRAPPSRD